MSPEVLLAASVPDFLRQPLEAAYQVCELANPSANVRAIVPLGGTHREMGDLSVAHGASPFGAGSVSGPGERPSDVEAGLARRQGEALARVARRLAG